MQFVPLLLRTAIFVKNNYRYFCDRVELQKDLCQNCSFSVYVQITPSCLVNMSKKIKFCSKAKPTGLKSYRKTCNTNGRLDCFFWYTCKLHLLASSTCLKKLNSDQKRSQQGPERIRTTPASIK